MDLEKLGLSHYRSFFPEASEFSAELLARVAAQNRTNYVLFSTLGELEGLVRGNMLKAAKESGDYPRVGDWVKIQKLQGERRAVIEKVLPRFTVLTRKENSERRGDSQVIVTNVDVLFIVQGLDNNYNPSRLERYLILAHESRCVPVIILNKSDASERADDIVNEVKKLSPGTQVVIMSAITGEGVEAVRSIIQPGLTYAFVGSSGVGKSTIINELIEGESQTVGAVRDQDSRGRHTTTRKELFVLTPGGMVIDTPGIRELGLEENSVSTKDIFDDIYQLSLACKYRDCDHEHSNGCAILEAVRAGTVAKKRYTNYLKMMDGSKQDFIKKHITKSRIEKNKQKKSLKNIYGRLRNE